MVPETANISLEEIDAVFGSSVGLQDAEFKRQVWMPSSACMRLSDVKLPCQIERELGLTDLIASLAASEQS